MNIEVFALCWSGLEDRFSALHAHAHIIHVSGGAKTVANCVLLVLITVDPGCYT